MGKAQKKTGKGRIDKFYKLAKEQGYRARSAFKLIQLNKKYNFLENARCCIDLCAAPGGWLQVASKYMPPSSIIIGIDLVPIKPIPKVTTFAADITTPICRNLIRGELKDWKADVVLHDGAPNVGTAWVQDAYSQSELVLMSLKLAVEFLMKGGTFVTKIFRSADYNNLIWVFNQLFGKVEATKPPASRNVSAEIFVVCREFHAPKFIDPKFLDPKHVFKELAPTTDAIDKSTSANNAHANVFMPEKKRRKRDGYDDGDYTLHKTTPASDFIYKTDAVGLLGTVNAITFTSKEERDWLKHPLTTSEIKSNCADLKVLGKGDFKALMKWRAALREEIGLDVKTKPTEELTDKVEIIEEVDEDEQIQEELERLNREAAAKAKRDRRKANEKKTRTIQRMQLQMTAPMDIGQELEDPSLQYGQADIFDLKTADRQRKTLLANEDISDSEDVSDQSTSTDSDEALDSDEEKEKRLEGLEGDLDRLYDAYKTQRSERDAKFKAKEARKQNKDREESWGGIRREKDSEESGSESDGGGWEEMQELKERSDDSSSDSEESGSEDSRPRKRKRSQSPNAESKTLKRPRLNGGLITKLEDKKAKDAPSKSSQIWFSQDIFKGVDEDLETTDESSSEEDPPQVGGFILSDAEDDGSEESENEDVGYEIVPQQPDEDVTMWDVDDEDRDAPKREFVKKFGLNTAEAMTLAQQLVNRQKTKTQLINDGFNRYSLNSKDGLPSWFLEDESKHYKPNIPITKEAVQALRAKQRQLDARPIKKIAEAKARKKLRAAQRLEKALKKAEGVNQTGDMTEKEKASQIEKLMRKGMGKGKQKKNEVKLVVAKGPNRGLKGRPKGVKGRYRMVDARGKKELRAQKRREKANRSKRR
ncbi:FtsJ-domain-containing protein [Serendipita vermifera]|nr:FtsJ-domain-containing protein [Serendipita vermifera]